MLFFWAFFMFLCLFFTFSATLSLIIKPQFPFPEPLPLLLFPLDNIVWDYIFIIYVLLFFSTFYVFYVLMFLCLFFYLFCNIVWLSNMSFLFLPLALPPPISTRLDCLRLGGKEEGFPTTIGIYCRWTTTIWSVGYIALTFICGFQTL